jgi:hypothetical protein
MKTYLMSVLTQVEVQAFDVSDAKDIVQDVFGEGAFGQMQVISHEICDEEELS